MSLRKFLTSKTFFIQVAIALGIIIVLVFVMLKWLSFTTNHGEEITVPDLSKLSVELTEEKLNALDLEYVLLDTTEYDSKYPKFSVVKQDPIAGSKVKQGRKIYININSDSYRDIVMPNLIEQSLRQVEPTLKALGLVLGEKTYQPYLGKDMVLEMRYKGKLLKAGDKIPKSSKIDLVLGDGKVGFEEEYEPAVTPIDNLDEEF